tara:strand:+ start:88 stop:489 length:402 start_codon:yes stop_codon:yes gene_type:complete
MSFVREKIPDADRERFKIPLEVRSWLADRNRDVYLICLRFGRERDVYFNFYYRGREIKIWGYTSGSGNFKEGMVVNYDIRGFWIPSDVTSRSQEISELYLEAMDEFCDSGRKIDNCIVNVQLPTNVGGGVYVV